jgi:hypothetical protein
MLEPISAPVTFHDKSLGWSDMLSALSFYGVADGARRIRFFLFIVVVLTGRIDGGAEGYHITEHRRLSDWAAGA